MLSRRKMMSRVAKLGSGIENVVIKCCGNAGASKNNDAC